MTNKFKFKFKIRELELEVEGSKKDVAAITYNCGNQLKALAQPQGLNEANSAYDAEVMPGNTIQIEPAKRKKGRKPRNSNNNSEGSTAALDFKSDSVKYGAPTTGWITAKKAMWLLYVVKNETSMSELSSNQIAQTFNKHFKQAKMIQLNNVTRDLGKLKLGGKALVGEDTTKSPSTWFLRDEGIRSVQALITGQLSSDGIN